MQPVLKHHLEVTLDQLGTTGSQQDSHKGPRLPGPGASSLALPMPPQVPAQPSPAALARAAEKAREGRRTCAL